MKWGADLQDLRALGAPFVGQLGSAFHRSSVTGNNNLLLRIDIRWFTDFTPGSVATNCSDPVEFHTENRRHRANPNRNRLLHIFAPIPHRAYCVGEAQSSRRNVRRIFSQAMPGDETRFEAIL